MNYTQLIILAAVFLGGAAVGTIVQKHAQANMQLEHQAEQILLQDQHNERLAALNQRNLQYQNKIDLLSAQAYRDLNESLAENDRLAADLAVAERMRLKGSSCPRTSAGADHPEAGQPGDGAGVELSEETRRLVWDLRRELIQDQQDILYLREYVRRIQETNPQ